jgi:hypothetical protein
MEGVTLPNYRRVVIKPQARQAANYGRRTCTTTDAADKRPRSHSQTLWRTDTDYLTAHRKPSRCSEQTFGCNQSDCDCRLKRREGGPFSDYLPGTHER